MEFFTNAREVYRMFEPWVSAQPSYKLVQVTIIKKCTESELLFVWHEIFIEVCIHVLACASDTAVYLAWGVCYSLHICVL